MAKVTNIEAFIKDMNEADKKFFRDFVGFHGDLSIRALKGMIDKTPVGKTGLLKKMWQLTLNRPSKSKRKSRDSLGTAKNRLAKLKPFQKVWIVNNASYASYVNYGTSQKGPKAMVEPVLASLDGEVRK